ncbi:MAG: phosphatase PAP2 family protein [Chitinophagaceae bacterium]|nr:phosphatase PAP2 family protein [Chitinophagaceae bacterium]
MKKPYAVLKQHRFYFGGLLLSFIAGGLFLLLYGKEYTFLSLNSYHPFFLNVFFINYTFMGDGIFAICLIGLMFFYFKNKQHGFALLYAFLFSGLVTQVLKNLISSPRPKIYFEQGTYLHFIDGVTLSGSSGFPSGHTATAFAIATAMILMMKNKNLQLLVLIAAIMVGYSRIYLAQHFLSDVLVGMIIGSAAGISAVYFAKNRIRFKRSINRIHRMPHAPASSTPGIQTA